MRKRPFPVVVGAVACCLPVVLAGCAEVTVTGLLVQATSCTLLESDDGVRYALDELGTFGPGDRVTARGTPGDQPDCPDAERALRDNTIAAAGGPFAQCGTLVQGVECVLFETDSGRRYLLDRRDGFEVGERVWVSGALDPDCVTICMEGEGCLRNTSIRPCTP